MRQNAVETDNLARTWSHDAFERLSQWHSHHSSYTREKQFSAASLLISCTNNYFCFINMPATEEDCLYNLCLWGWTMQSLSKSLIVAEIPLLLTVFLLTEGAVWIVWIPPPPPNSIWFYIISSKKLSINYQQINSLVLMHIALGLRRKSVIH